MSILYEILITSLFTVLLCPPNEEKTIKEHCAKLEQVLEKEKDPCQTYGYLQ